ncbi:MAG: class II aldolase/adducin family protein [Burkholderiaceae bacterium]|tara:strand:+ start:83 stop:733 length:651 start_codon:yes stop_codon:yes gene_type:complete
MVSKKQKLIEACNKISRLGLIKGSSGNLSLRIDTERYLLTSSGCSLEHLKDQDIVTMSIDGKIISGENPSSEWMIHGDLYKERSDIRSIVHTHSKYVCVLACLHKELPPFHYMVAIAGGENIRCCPYELFGTKKLSNNVIEAMKNRNACLMANHGLVVGSSSLANSVYIAEEVESLCEQYVNALAIGNVQLLSQKQMKDVLEKFKNYGAIKKVEND